MWNGFCRDDVLLDQRELKICAAFGLIAALFCLRCIIATSLGLTTSAHQMKWLELTSISSTAEPNYFSFERYICTLNFQWDLKQDLSQILFASNLWSHHIMVVCTALFMNVQGYL